MSRVIQCELILPITAKFICVYTMYVHCIPRQLAWFWHGSWRVVCTEMNTLFGAMFVGHCMYNVYTLYVRAMMVSQWLTEVYRERWFADALSANCSRENVGGEMFAGKRSARFAHTAHASLMGAYAPKRSANRALSREGRSSRARGE